MATVGFGLYGGANIDGTHPDNGGDIQKNLGGGSDSVVLQIIMVHYVAGGPAPTPVVINLDCGNVGDQAGNSWLPAWHYGTPQPYENLLPTINQGDVIIIAFAFYGTSTGSWPRDLFKDLISAIEAVHDAIVAVAVKVGVEYISEDIGFPIPDPSEALVQKTDVEHNVLNTLDTQLLASDSNHALVGTVHAVVSWPVGGLPNVDITPGFNATRQQVYENSPALRQRYFVTSLPAIYEPVVKVDVH